MPVLDAFGECAKCTSLQALVSFLRETPANHPMRVSAAAYGMALAAMPLSRKPTSFEEASEFLKELARAKAAIDTAADASDPVPHVTACILRAAQDFVDRTTIPCTEWPSTEEIAEVVVNEASSWAWSAPSAQ